jgi:hypothetical protein
VFSTPCATSSGLLRGPFDEAARGARFSEEELADSLPRAEREVLGETRSLLVRRVAECYVVRKSYILRAIFARNREFMVS